MPPIASKYLSPASIGKSHPVHFAWNIRRKSREELRHSLLLEAEKCYLRRSMVLLLRHEMFPFQLTSCTQCRGNIPDASFYPEHEHIPKMHRRHRRRLRSDSMFTFKIFCAHFAQSTASICSKSFSQYSLPFSSTKPQSTRSTEQCEQVKWLTQKQWPIAEMNGPLEIGMCLMRIERIIIDRLPNFDTTSMADSDLIGRVILIQQCTAFTTLLSDAIATKWGFTSS